MQKLRWGGGFQNRFHRFNGGKEVKVEAGFAPCPRVRLGQQQAVKRAGSGRVGPMQRLRGNKPAPEMQLSAARHLNK